MPRSLSRDRADRFATNRGYFRQPDSIRRAKHWLALAALGLTGGWAIVDASTPQRVVASHTHGPLASVHAAWDNNCEACHKPASLSSAGFASLFRAGDRWLDLTCEKCHAGPAHHAATADKTANGRCADCHHDHGGRTNSLVRLADASCTNCHANLPDHRTADALWVNPAAERIVNFLPDGGHPEFRELAQHPPDEGTPYPRALKFSHALHMAPGQAYRKDGRKWAVTDLADPTTRDRYRAPGQADGDAVQLRCESCHQLDSGFAAAGQPGGDEFARLLQPLADQPKRSILPPRAAGAYYLPVNFDAHCKACHPIAAPATKSGEFVISAVPLPHRKQPSELKTVLQGEYASRLTFPDNPTAPAPAGPGGRLDPRAPAGPTAFRAESTRLADAALKTLLLGATKPDATPAAGGFSGYACGKCHSTDNPTVDPAAQHIAPIPDKTVWFPHAKFDHAAHRATACADCHPGTGPAYAADGVTVAYVEREPIRIRGVESCRECHNPTAGVRSGCTDCHRYHDGDHPFRGRGAEARNPAAPLTVADFLAGGTGRTP